MIMVDMTKHAQKRWKQRFNNLNLEYEFKNSRKPKKVELANLKKQCPENSCIMSRRELYGLFYKISVNKVAFVCNENNLVITVFPYVPIGWVKGKQNSVDYKPYRIYNK